MVKYYTPEEVSNHNDHSDIYVSLNSTVLNLTSFLKLRTPTQSMLLQPIIDAAGTDISHWFTKAGEVKTYVDPESFKTVAYTPVGKFLHCDGVSEEGEVCWWKNENHIIGKLSEKTRKINIINTLTQQTHLLTTPSEETLQQIQERYLSFNNHASSYTWKRLFSSDDGENSKFIVMDMSKTLEENGIEDEEGEFERLGIEEDFYIPVVHIYFNDDLSIA